MSFKSFYFAWLVFFLGSSVLTIPMQSQAYDKPYIGEQKIYRALYEDTFVYIARDFNLGFVELRAANPGVDPWVPGKGTKLILPKRHLLPDAPREGIVINLPEMRLYGFLEDQEPFSYPLGVGRQGLDTPLGTTKIIRKAERPSWRPTKRMREEDPELPEVVEPGPENPLGTHALYLGWPAYAIHGTNRPFGIGRRISSGCIRLYPESIIKLYDKVPVGTKVTVVDQPIKVAWIDDYLYIEAHPSLENAVQMEEQGKVEFPELSEEDVVRILKVAGEHKDRLQWGKIREAVRERRGYPIRVAWRPGFSSEPDEEEKFEPEPEEVSEALEEIYVDEKADSEQKAAHMEFGSRYNE